MNRNKRTGIWLAIAIIAIAGAAFGYYLYNKGPMDVAHASSEKIGAAALYAAFLSDSSAAFKNYSGKVLTVSGTVAQVSNNQEGQQLILLNTSTEGAHVNCTMETPVPNAQAGEQLNIKGICSGIGQGDADLGIPGDVYITRSIQEK